MKKSFFIVIWLCFIGSESVFSQIVNLDTLYIGSGAQVYFENSYTNNNSAHHFNEGSLYVNSDFINDGLSSSTSGTTYFTSSTNSIQHISGVSNELYLGNLVIDNSQLGVQVADNFGLYVSNGVQMIDGDLRLTGEAQLIQTHSGTSMNSAVNGALLRDQQGLSSTYGYNYWSAPVNNGGSFSLNGGLFDGTDAALNPFNPQQIGFVSSGYDGTPSVIDGSGNVITPLAINTNVLFRFFQNSGEAYGYWYSLDENSTLSAGEGFIMKGPGSVEANQNYVFKGNPNDGDYQYQAYAGGFYLIGNPYPSSLAVEEFIKDNISSSEGGNAAFNKITGTIYFWVDGGTSSHSYADYFGGYATRNLTAGAPPAVATGGIGGLGTAATVDPPTPYMAVGQAFFVESLADGMINFKNSQRVFKIETSGDSHFYREMEEKSTDEKSLIRIGYDSPDGYHRQLVLGFLPNTLADLDYNLAYDAFTFDYRYDDLFFIIENDESKKYIIQGVGAFDSSYEFPVGITISQEGTHTIQIDNTENFSGSVYLKDEVSGNIQNLSDGNFSFSLPPGDYLDRFKITFQPAQAVLDVNDVEEQSLNIYCHENELIIINEKGESLKHISVYNTLGQLILQKNNNLGEDRRTILPFHKEVGVYLVLLQTATKQQTFKIIKKN